MEQNIAEYEYLALVINYNDFLKRTIIKKEYFEGKDKILFEIITKEYKKNNALVLAELIKYNNFDLDYYMELLENNLYNSSREKQFKILEKQIIENFKSRQLKRTIELFSGNIDEFYKQIDKIRELNIEENEYITAEDMINTLEEKNSQVKLGFSDLDKALYISQNDFVILAGGTGTGKTTFALNLLSNLSKEYQCVYFNMEMSKKTLYKRLSAIETGININKFNDIRTLETKEVKFLYQKISEIEERKIILINNSQNIDNIEKIISNIKDDRKIVVILDHIGLINSQGNSLYEKMTNVAKKIRGLCLDYNCTIFGLCQLSRESQKDEREPKLQDLRDSGEIEQSARKVILLYNKNYKKQIDIKNVDILVAKNDDGSCLVKNFKFDTKKQKFVEVGNGH
jgi:replicative DNA helicase